MKRDFRKKKYFFAGLALFLGFEIFGCTRPFGPNIPPPFVTPTSTPTLSPTPGSLSGTPTPSSKCLVPPALNVLTGTGGSTCFPIQIILNLATPAVTPVPTATPTWTGSLPPHAPGTFVLQTLADWNNYIATSYYPAASVAPPFTPGAQKLAVNAYVSSTMGTEGIIEVCDDGTYIHVVVEELPACYGNPPAYSCSSPAVEAVVVPNNGEPVVWDYVYINCPPGIAYRGVRIKEASRFFSGDRLFI